MRQHGIVHPEMLERVQPNFYPSLCTIQVSTDTDDPFGETIPSWADVAGLIDIPCRISPMSTREISNADQVYTAATHHVALNGYYPSIHAGHQAVIDGVAYQIEGPPQHDGNDKTTRIYVKEVE